MRLTQRCRVENNFLWELRERDCEILKNSLKNCVNRIKFAIKLKSSGRPANSSVAKFERFCLRKLRDEN